MSDPKKQHYVPQCYLREFVDPQTPAGYEPYVCVFSKDGKHKEKRAPKNLFHETELYTLNIEGEKHYTIERSLSALEGEYASVVRNKIKKYLPLSEEEHLTICAFVAAMMQRTVRFKDNIESFHDQLIEKVAAMEQLHGLNPAKSAELRESKRDAHKLGVLQLLPELTELLFRMTMSYLCTDGRGSRFISSDDPVTLFNPDLQWQRFYGPGLAQTNVQVTMPVSPDITLGFTWSDFRGYIRLPKNRVEDLNRMTRAHCYRQFISSGSKTKRVWFSRVPFDMGFLCKAAINVIRRKFLEWKFAHRYGRNRKR
jgi:Protein of unknown function (DUF4238)